MGCIGRKIVLARTYEEEKLPPPNLNYEYKFPVTVLEAIKENMEDADKDNVKNLKNIIEEIWYELRSKQPIIPGHDPNNLMTFAGTRGAVGSIPITREIPWDPEKQSHSKIPTEKAVGDLMFKLGLMDADGNPIDPERDKIRWSDIIGRPFTYEGLGNNENGFITQKGITLAFNSLKTELLDKSDELVNRVDKGLENISKHLQDKNNPHFVTYQQIGAAAADAFEEHCNTVNPHGLTPADINLGNVNNTSDEDKPLSKAQRDVITRLEKILNDFMESTNALDFLESGEYDQTSGWLTLHLRHGDSIKIYIPIDDLVDEIVYNKETKELEVIELNGEINKVDVSDLFIRYIGSVSDSITVEIDGDNITGEQIIRATLNEKGINSNALADGSIVTRILADKCVTGEKIADGTIITINYKDESITTEKIAKFAITSSRLADRSVNGRVLFSSNNDERLLGVHIADDDPVWTKLTSGMIGSKVILNEHYSDKSITADKLADGSVTNPKLRTNSVSTEKIQDESVTHDKLATDSVDGMNIIRDVILFGQPTLFSHPDINSKDFELIDADWVLRRLVLNINENTNYADRSVDGRVLFTSEARHRVLAVLRAGTDAVWSLIDSDMMDDNSVSTRSIQEKAITSEKIRDMAIQRSHLSNYIITENHIDESAVTPEKIFKSDTEYTVLGVLSKENDHPQYVKIIKEMMAPNSVGTEEIIDRSLSTSKLTPSEESYRVLVTKLKNSTPVWDRITTNMIAERAVNGRNLFSSSDKHVVLAVTDGNADPAWMKIYSEMIYNDAIKQQHIDDKAIKERHLEDGIIGPRHIQDSSINSWNIVEESITGSKIFRSEMNYRVLATVNGPFSIPTWSELSGKMLEDQSIENTKLFRSENDHRVLAVTKAGIPPEYIMITSDFIVDDSIIPQKLVRDFTLFGTPSITNNPKDSADNLQIPSTSWVRKTVFDMLHDSNILFGSITTDMFVDQSVTGEKLFRSKYDGPRVLGVTEKGEIPEWMLVENAMLADGSVTEEKLVRNIHLLGSPTVDVRPSPFASTAAGDGNLIPDCQWVLDRITSAINDGWVPDGGGTGGTPSLDPADGSVTTIKIQDRAVTGDKLFTSPNPNMVLAVLKENTSPIYTKLINQMISDRSVNGRVLFTSEADHRIIGVKNAGDDPDYIKIDHDMLEEEIISEEQLMESSVTESKIADESLRRRHFKNEAIIDNILLYDNAVTTQKISNKNITNEKLHDHSVDSRVLDRDINLKGTTTVNNSIDNNCRSVRNTIISHSEPVNSSNGDIWFKYY